MLTKKQAKIFFLGGTLLFALIFLGLSYDTVSSGIKENTHPENITDAVLLGRTIWDEQNCMGCHTLMGEGAYYAPELTKVYERRGPVYIKTAVMFKNDGLGWGSRGRHMVEYDFTEEEADGLVAFFKWVGEMYLNDYPATPSIPVQTPK